MVNIQLQWLNPDNNHELLWDYSMCADTSRGAAIRDLIARALKGPLAPAQQEVHCYILIFLQDNDDCFIKLLVPMTRISFPLVSYDNNFISLIAG